MSIFATIAGLVKPITNLIDNLHTSDEEKGRIKNELVSMEYKMMSQVLDYEKEMMKAQSKIITAEAMGASWLQRTWRPLTMMTLLVLIICDSFGLLAFRLSEEAWVLIQLGLGGYIVGRSGEKIANVIKNGKNK